MTITTPVGVPKTHETMLYPDQAIALFTPAEYEAAPMHLRDQLTSAGRLIDITNPRFIAGVESLGLSSEREDIILAGQPI